MEPEACANRALHRTAMLPHCPFDSIVLARIPGCDKVRWTQFDSTAEYQRIVRAAKSIAGTLCQR